MYAVLAFSHQSEYLGTKISIITEEVVFRTRRIVIQWFFIIAWGGGRGLRKLSKAAWELLFINGEEQGTKYRPIAILLLKVF